MPRALIIGGTGLIGRATATRLLAAGWQVDLTGRNPARLPAHLAAAGSRFMPADREDAAQLAAAFGDGADLLVDCLCYTATHARMLLPLARHTTSTVMISAKAVYVDAAGNHANSPTPPRFHGPITEQQPTMAPAGPDTDYRTGEGYGASKVTAEHVLLDSGAPVTVLRPGKIHGRGASTPREWVFVKRALDQRPAVLLARGGPRRGPAHRRGQHRRTHRNGGHTGAAHPQYRRPRRPQRAADRVPGGGGADLTVRSPACSATSGGRSLLYDDADPTLGHHPWNVPHPVVLDTGAATRLGYTPAGDYAATVTETVDWLASRARDGDGDPARPRRPVLRPDARLHPRGHVPTTYDLTGA